MESGGSVVDAAAEFIWSDARLLERRRFACRFRDGRADDVVTALVAYRNDDGGFGHALEPDLRAPNSQPVCVDVALGLLAELRLAHDELISGALDFLVHVSTDGHIGPALETAFTHPRAGHWNPGVWPDDTPNPVASIAGSCHTLGVTHPWLDRATEWCWSRVDAGPFDDAHELLAIVSFLEHVPDRARAAAVTPLVLDQIASARWYVDDPASTDYGVTPLHFVPAPDAVARKHFGDALIEAFLDALAADQQADGGWPIRFEPPSPAAISEWRGIWTYEALTRLTAWHRL